MTRTTKLLGGTGLLGVLLAGAVVLFLPPREAVTGKAPPRPSLTVTVVQAARGQVPVRLLVTGSVTAMDELPIGTEAGDLALVAVLADIGDHVTRGQVLARFDDRTLQAQVRLQEAALMEAEAQSREAEANARRAEDLVKGGWMSRMTFDERRAQAETARARVEVARANLSLARVKLQQAEVRAPAAGTITARNAHLGAVLTTGGSDLFRMIRDDRVELVADLPEGDLARIAPGQKVLFAIDGSGAEPAAESRAATGLVRMVEPTVDPRTRQGRVRIDIPKGAGLLPGMFVAGRIDLGEVGAVVIPERAVTYQDNKPSAFVVADGERVILRPLMLGARQGALVAVTQGLEAGDRVVEVGAGHLKDGDHVAIAGTDTGSGPVPAVTE